MATNPLGQPPNEKYSSETVKELFYLTVLLKESI